MSSNKQGAHFLPNWHVYPACQVRHIIGSPELSCLKQPRQCDRYVCLLLNLIQQLNDVMLKKTSLRQAGTIGTVSAFLTCLPKMTHSTASLHRRILRRFGRRRLALLCGISSSSSVVADRNLLLVLPKQHGCVQHKDKGLQEIEPQTCCYKHDAMMQRGTDSRNHCKEMLQVRVTLKLHHLLQIPI